MTWLLKKALATALGRWVTGGVVALLLGLAGLAFHNHKEGLKEEGKLECVQEINQATIDALEDALADERRAAAALRANLIAAAAVNREAIDRREEVEAEMRTLEAEMRTQRETDETYRTWADADLPDGVADRLRQAAGSPSGDSN